MNEPTLAEKVLFALRVRFPGAMLEQHTIDYGNVLIITFYEANETRHFYSTPPAQDYRQHDVPWLVHRFVSVITPAYAAAQVRGTLEKARLED